MLEELDGLRRPHVLALSIQSLTQKRREGNPQIQQGTLKAPQCPVPNQTLFLEPLWPVAKNT